MAALLACFITLFLYSDLRTLEQHEIFHQFLPTSSDLSLILHFGVNIYYWLCAHATAHTRTSMSASEENDRIHVSIAVAQRWEPPSLKVIKARVENMIGMRITRETTQEKRLRDT